MFCFCTLLTFVLSTQNRSLENKPVCTSFNKNKKQAVSWKNGWTLGVFLDMANCIAWHKKGAKLLSRLPLDAPPCISKPSFLYYFVACPIFEISERMAQTACTKFPEKYASDHYKCRVRLAIKHVLYRDYLTLICDAYDQKSLKDAYKCVVIQVPYPSDAAEMLVTRIYELFSKPKLSNYMGRLPAILLIIVDHFRLWCAKQGFNITPENNVGNPYLDFTNDPTVHNTQAELEYLNIHDAFPEWMIDPRKIEESNNNVSLEFPSSWQIHKVIPALLENQVDFWKNVQNLPYAEDFYQNGSEIKIKKKRKRKKTAGDDKSEHVETPSVKKQRARKLLNNADETSSDSPRKSSDDDKSHDRQTRSKKQRLGSEGHNNSKEPRQLSSPVDADKSNQTSNATLQQKSSDLLQEKTVENEITVANANDASLDKNPGKKTIEITQDDESNGSVSKDDENEYGHEQDTEDQNLNENFQKDQDRGDEEYFALCHNLHDEVCKICRSDSTYNELSEETVPLLKHFIQLSSTRVLDICKQEGMSDDFAKRVFKKLVGTSADKSNLNV